MLSKLMSSDFSFHANKGLYSVVIALVTLCIAITFIQLGGAGWAYDDVNLVQPSPALNDLAGLQKAISTDLYRQAAPRLEASAYWRPLAMASFWFDTRFGTPPGVLHIGNILLHIIAAALLVLVVLRRHGGGVGSIAALVASIWWAFHPQNSEVVAWISCRYDLLYGVVLLILLAVQWRSGIFGTILFGTVFFAGLLSKEGFIMVIAVIVIMDITDRKPIKLLLSRWAAVALAVIIWMILRMVVGVKSFDPPTLEAALTILRIYPEALTMYFLRSFAFVPLSISHPYSSIGVPGILGGIAIFSTLTMISIRWPKLAVPSVIFLAGIFPITGAITMFQEVPERYFYVPSIGLALLLAHGVTLVLTAWKQSGSLAVSQKKTSYKLIYPLLLAIIGIFLFRSIILFQLRLPDWRTNETLWSAAARVNQNDSQANLNRAIAAGRAGNWDEALRAIDIASRGDPKSGRIACTYAWALIRTGDFPGAIQKAEQATILAPYEPDGWYYLAFAKHKNGDYAGTLAAVIKLLEVAPDYPGARQMYEVVTKELSKQ
ncbi:MAG: tetratricopeptide repeat protein [Fibrobacter sp.]|nr:tetratricopeptide repeat protein [Fibrobacter sp.]